MFEISAHSTWDKLSASQFKVPAMLRLYYLLSSWNLIQLLFDKLEAYPTKALVLGLCLAGLSAGVDAEEFPTFTNPSKAGFDFLVQGEYAGLVGGSQTIAAQVIAMGGGKFEGVLYGGGLPGAGWDETTRFHFRGETKDGVTRFIALHGERLKYENPNFTGELREGIFKGTADYTLKTGKFRSEILLDGRPRIVSSSGCRFKASAAAS